MKTTYFGILMILITSCGNNEIRRRIVKAETEFGLNCADGDTCIRSIKNYFSDGTWKNTLYLKYPSHKMAQTFDSNGKFISEMQVNGDDSILNTMVYDEFGNKLKYIRDHQTKLVPNAVYEYENSYDETGNLKSQVEYDLYENVKARRNVYYDSLGFSKIQVNLNRKGDTSFVEFYKDTQLVKEQYYRPLKYLRYFKYDEEGVLIYEDAKHDSYLRTYFYYHEGLIDSEVTRFRVRIDGVSLDSAENRVYETVKYKHRLDRSGRPIKTDKSIITNGELVPESFVVTKYY